MAQKPAQAYQASPEDYKLNPQNKNIGQLRSDDRYRLSDVGPRAARSRKVIDDSFTSDREFMSDAVKDTPKLIQKTAQARDLARARAAQPAPKKMTQGKGLR